MQTEVQPSRHVEPGDSTRRSSQPAVGAEATLPIDVTLVPNPRACPPGKLGFGRVFTDHIFQMDWGGAGGPQWHAARIVPWAQLALEPSASVLHYAQSIFEGLKAFRGADGKLRTFRPDRHAARFMRSAERICMPPIAAAQFVAAVDKLVRIEEAWVPSAPGGSLYIRPTMIATEGFLGVRPAQIYTCFVIVGPVDAYYAEGFGPVRIWVEQAQVRAAPGGLGEAKTGANYAASLQAAELAKKKGYAQVLWLDAVERRFVEEVGTMNFFVRIGDEFITPPLEGSILPGVTRESVIALLRERGAQIHERRISIDEIRAAHRAGTLREVFGTGTAAVVSPVGVLGFTDGDLVIGDGQPGEYSRLLHDDIVAIQRAQTPDRFGWTHDVP